MLLEHVNVHRKSEFYSYIYIYIYYIYNNECETEDKLFLSSLEL